MKKVMFTSIIGFLLACIIFYLFYEHKKMNLDYKLTEYPKEEEHTSELCYISGVCIKETKKYYYLTFEKPDVKEKGIKIEKIYQKNGKVIINVLETKQGNDNQKAIKIKKEHFKIKNVLINKIK